MTDLILFTDVEGAMRTWLRRQPLVKAQVGGRIFFGMPDDGAAAFPLVTLARIGGKPQTGLAPLEDVRLTLTVWAGSKRTAIEVVRSICTSLQGMASEALDAEVVGYGAVVDSVLWLPDPDDNTPRYVVDTTVTVRAA